MVSAKSHFFVQKMFTCFCYKNLIIYSKSILSARLVLVKRSLVRKPYYLLCFRHPFFKEAALGRPKVCNCRQTDFFKTVFSFFHIFKHPLFRAANLSKMRLSLVRGVTFRIWCRFLAPSGGGVRRALLWAKPLFYLRNLMFFLKNINFTIGFSYFSALAGLWGASGASGRLLETFSESLWSHLWSWRLSGILFGRICVLFGLLFCLSTSHGIIFSKFQA